MRTSIDPTPRARAVGWVVLVAVTTGLVMIARVVRIPSPEIVAAMVAGTAIALSGRGPRRVPTLLGIGSQAVVGTALGPW
ncbi:AbrB family transcriptional regulator [Raineyella fluvialis]|uniref:AbrB family transcriptional regulator n=1 Tax=Raineyella fluvialis TaxID=2662261 RepID=UPI00188EFB2E|nr:AbrB family transcriptional regulator [Raineyella fluvialis]